MDDIIPNRRRPSAIQGKRGEIKRRLVNELRRKINEETNNYKEEEQEPLLGSSENELDEIEALHDRTTISPRIEHDSANQKDETQNFHDTEQEDKSSGDFEHETANQNDETQNFHDTEQEDKSSGDYEHETTNQNGETQKFLDTEHEDKSNGDCEVHDMSNTVHHCQKEKVHSINISEDGDAHSMNNAGRKRKVDLGWIFVMSNFILELPSTVFEQLPSKNKSGYVLASLVISFVAITICIAELLRNVKKANATWKWRPFPWFYHHSENQKPFGTFRENVGLVSAFGQCIVATINYGCWHLHADSTIKAPVSPVVFAFGLLCSKLADDRERKDKSSNGNEIPPHIA